MERQTEKHVKAIRSDNDTEFKNGELNHFCAERGIARTSPLRIHHNKTVLLKEGIAH